MYELKRKMKRIGKKEHTRAAESYFSSENHRDGMIVTYIFYNFVIFQTLQKIFSLSILSLWFTIECLSSRIICELVNFLSMFKFENQYRFFLGWIKVIMHVFQFWWNVIFATDWSKMKLKKWKKTLNWYKKNFFGASSVRMVHNSIRNDKINSTAINISWLQKYSYLCSYL